MNESKRESVFLKVVSLIAKCGLGHFTSDMLRKRIKFYKNFLSVGVNESH